MVKKRSVSKNIAIDKSESRVSVSSTFLTLVKKHLLYVIVGAVIFSVAIAGLLLWKYFNNKKEEKAMVEYCQAYIVYEESIEQEKSPEEALQLFQSVAEEYRGTNAETLSLFYAGNCQFAMKKFDEAINSYNKFLKSLTVETHLAVLAYDSLGYCYEGKKDFNNAIEFFKKTITPPPGLGESGYLNIARCYELLSDKENSLAFYKKIIFEYPDSQRIDFVREKIRLLESIS